MLTWVNRIVRIKERCEDLFGRFGTRTRVIRTSNGYQFNDPKAAASKGFPWPQCIIGTQISDILDKT